ncbi:LOW QUALITY PROTEIN: transmembrane protein 272 [Dugong dugon]
MPGGLERACHCCISKIANNACFIFLLFAFLVLLMSMFFTGMKFLEDCPIPVIPLYLLVGVIVGTLRVSLLLYDSTRMRRLLSKAVVIDDDDDDDEYPWRQNAHKYYVHLVLSLFLFLFLWFILGNYWVFSVHLPDFPPFQQPQDYCEKTLCIFAVGVLVLSHAVLVLLALCSSCVYLCSRWRFAVDEDREPLLRRNKKVLAAPSAGPKRGCPIPPLAPCAVCFLSTGAEEGDLIGVQLEAPARRWTLASFSLRPPTPESTQGGGWGVSARAHTDAGKGTMGFHPLFRRRLLRHSASVWTQN